MSLTDEVATYAPYRKREWVDEQLGDEADEFAVLLADPKVSPSALAKALNRRGITIPARTVHAWAQRARGES